MEAADYVSDRRLVDTGEQLLFRSQAFLYYQGKEITDTEGTTRASATTYETSTHNWVEFKMSKNPGEYQIKILVGGKLSRVISFTIDSDGKLVDNGFARQANLKNSWIFPAQIVGSVEGDINREAYKTDAFYGNSLSGFAAP